MEAHLHPDGARAAGLLPHRTESMVPGEEFQEDFTQVKKRKTKHPVGGAIDLEAMLSTHLAAQAAQHRPHWKRRSWPP